MVISIFISFSTVEIIIWTLIYSLAYRGGWNRTVNLPSPYFLSQFLPPPYFWANFSLLPKLQLFFFSLLPTFSPYFSLLPTLFGPFLPPPYSVPPPSIYYIKGIFKRNFVFQFFKIIRASCVIKFLHFLIPFKSKHKNWVIFTLLGSCTFQMTPCSPVTLTCSPVTLTCENICNANQGWQ